MLTRPVIARRRSSERSPLLLLLALALAMLPCLACSDNVSPLADAAVPPQDSGACSPISPRSVPLVVSVLPDDGEKPFIELINRAQKSLWVYAYLMGTGGILNGLKQKAQSGVEVRVIFDLGQSATNTTYYNQLQAAGASVLWSDPKYTHMHAKVIIGDAQEALVTTSNYSKYYSIDRNRDFVALSADPDDVADLVALFDADWRRAAPALPCTRLLVSPINARRRLLELIESASSSLTIESMQLADTEVRDAVAARKKAGVDVRVLLADPSWVSANATAAKYLVGEGIPVRWMSDPAVHAKTIVVDNQRAYLGSINLSMTSLDKNREVGLVVLDAAAVGRISSTFASDWFVAKAF